MYLPGRQLDGNILRPEGMVHVMQRTQLAGLLAFRGWML